MCVCYGQKPKLEKSYKYPAKNKLTTIFGQNVIFGLYLSVTVIQLSLNMVNISFKSFKLYYVLSNS